MASGDGHGECTWNVWYGVCCPATCCNVFNTLVGKSAAARRIAAASTFCRFRGVSLTAGPTMPGVFPAGVPVHKPPLYYRCLWPTMPGVFPAGVPVHKPPLYYRCLWPPCLESFQLEYLYTNHLYITGVCAHHAWSLSSWSTCTQTTSILPVCGYLNLVRIPI